MTATSPTLHAAPTGPPPRYAAVVIDIDIAPWPLRRLHPVGTTPAARLPESVVTVTEAARHAGIPVHAFASSFFGVSELVHNTDLHIDRTTSPRIMETDQRGYAIHPTPDIKGALRAIASSHQASTTDLLVVTCPDGTLDRARKHETAGLGITYRYAEDIDPDPDIDLNPELAWARPDRGWVRPAHDIDPDDLTDLLCAGRIHPDHRAWALHRAAGMQVGCSPFDGWPTDLMTRREVRRDPWTAIRLARAMWPPLRDVNVRPGGTPSFAIAPYTGPWRNLMQTTKDWHRRWGGNRSGMFASPDLLFSPAIALAVALDDLPVRPAVIPVPAHRHSSDRPAQTSERLAELVADLAGLPLARCLERDASGGYTRASRPPMGPVVLIDDQVTTGRTMRACARLLPTASRLVGCYSITASAGKVQPER